VNYELLSRAVRDRQIDENTGKSGLQTSETH
jgi:hypothetical protein